jgi:serine/threonine protein kinase
VKLENILIMDINNVGDSAVLADFGYCKKVTTDVCNEDFVGSAFYAAPELLTNSDYDERIDIWAVGIVMFCCLTATLPFNCFNYDTAAVEIVAGLPDLEQRLMDAKIPSDAADLMRKLLTKDRNRRLRADEALSHPWFASLLSGTTNGNTRLLNWGWGLDYS